LDRMEKQGSVYPDEKSFSLIDFINRHRLLIIILIATVIICMLVLISVSIIVPVVLTTGGGEKSSAHSSVLSPLSSLSSLSSQSSPDEEPEECAVCIGTPLYFEPRIRNTTESQIDIYETTLWTDREAQIEQWIAIANEESVYLNTSYAQVFQTTREQKILSAKGCNSKVEFRTRVNIDGDGTGDGYIDAKGNDKDIYTACTLPYDPAPMYQTNSSQKCELDIHECPDDDKYSRETRIFFAGYFLSLTMCKHLVELFPDSIDLAPSDDEVELTTRLDQTWWAKKYIGYLDNDTKYEMTFTLRYHSAEDAMNAKDPRNNVEPAAGEWSIRLFSLGDGFTDEWNENVVDDVATMYNKLMVDVGRPGYCD